MMRWWRGLRGCGGVGGEVMGGDGRRVCVVWCGGDVVEDEDVVGHKR